MIGASKHGAFEASGSRIKSRRSLMLQPRRRKKKKVVNKFKESLRNLEQKGKAFRVKWPTAPKRTWVWGGPNYGLSLINYAGIFERVVNKLACSC